MVRVRIDPKCEAPQSRQFNFDPVDMVLSLRLGIAAGVLTLVNGYFAAGAPKLAKGGSGFAEWDTLVRNLVLWVGAQAWSEDLGVLGDPAKSIVEDATAGDPDHEALVMMLDALREAFGESIFVAKDAFALYAQGGDFHDAITAIMPRRAEMTSVALGHVFRHRRDRIAGGWVLRLVGHDKKNGNFWLVGVG